MDKKMKLKMVVFSIAFVAMFVAGYLVANLAANTAAEAMKKAEAETTITDTNDPQTRMMATFREEISSPEYSVTDLTLRGVGPARRNAVEEEK